MLELCGGFVQNLGDALPEEIRELALRGSHGYGPSRRLFSPAYRTPSLLYGKCRGETIAEEISEAMKSLPALIEQGNGFSKVLKMHLIIQLQQVHQEVFSGCYGKPDVKPESFVTQIETTPTETSTRNTADLVVKRKKAKVCPQRKWYPLRPKRINLDT
ncbi:Kinetochore-Associated Protein Nsl1 [Manis pentadactyla]|nr:Kinetochore-Associated Protein Nsl1 [Manis pentadactyla]